jgi:hypothetical protein
MGVIEMADLLIGDLSHHTLEVVVSHQVQILRLVVVEVLAGPHPRLNVRSDFRETRGVNAQPVASMNG